MELKFEEVIKLLTPITKEECNEEQVNIYKVCIIPQYIGYMNEHGFWLYKGNVHYHEFYKVKYQDVSEIPNKLEELYNWLIKDKLL